MQTIFVEYGNWDIQFCKPSCSAVVVDTGEPHLSNNAKTKLIASTVSEKNVSKVRLFMIKPFFYWLFLYRKGAKYIACDVRYNTSH